MDLEDSLTYLPEPALLTVVLNLDIRSLANLSQTKLRDFLSDPYILDKLAVFHNLPFSDSLGQLLKFGLMNPAKLALISAGKGDRRVFEGLSKDKNVDYNSMVSALIGLNSEGQFETLKEILNPKSLLKLSNFSYNAIMGNAAWDGYLDIVKLMANGQGLTSQNQNDQYDALDNAADLAAVGNHTEIVDYLISLDADPNGIMIAAAGEGNIGIVQKMLDLRADEYDLAMANAAQGGYLEIVQLMLNNGADDYESSLVAADGGGYHDEVEELFEKHLNHPGAFRPFA